MVKPQTVIVSNCAAFKLTGGKDPDGAVGD
jgi:hypothetical protein